MFTNSEPPILGPRRDWKAIQRLREKNFPKEMGPNQKRNLILRMMTKTAVSPSNLENTK